MLTATTYRDAAIKLWGRTGAYAHDTYSRLLPLYPGLPPSLPIVIGITAYGHCNGLTRGDWEHGQRISVFSSLFGDGRLQVDDLMAHEMLHAWLMTQGSDPAHKGRSWYGSIKRLSPAILGREVDARRGADRKSVRVPNPAWHEGSDEPKTIVRKKPIADVIQHGDVARWPYSFRPEGYDWGKPIMCPAY